MVPPRTVSRAAATLSTSAGTGVDGSSQNPTARTTIPAITRPVTTTIVHAWALTVRRAWVPFSVERSQSPKPVSAAGTATAARPISANDPARYQSRAQASAPPPTDELTSHRAAGPNAPTSQT